MKKYKSWFKKSLLIIFTLLISVGIFNMIIDPYNAINFPIIKNLNEKKASNQEYFLKANYITYNKPDTIFLGTSRVRIGLDPNYYEQITGEKAYNLGLSASNMYIQRKYFEYALLKNPNLKTVIIGIDFEAFNKYVTNNVQYTAENFNITPMRTLKSIKDIISLDYTRTSLTVLSENYFNTSQSTYLYNGLDPANYYLNESKSLLQIGVNRFYFHLAQQVNDPHNLKKYKLSDNQMENLEFIVQACKENGIELHVFIPPAHVVQSEAIMQLGYGNIVQEWKKEVVNITPIWDFSDYNSITTVEPNNFNHYLDQSHFNREIGNLILDKMLKVNDNPNYPDFGVLLTKKNITLQIKLQNEKRSSWRQNHKAIIENILTTINSDYKYTP